MKIYSNEYEKIKILQQNNAYKYLSNFERDDLELIIDGKNSSLDIFERTNEFKEEEKSKNCNKAQRIEYNLKTGFSFFVKFEAKGFHAIQIFFKKNYMIVDFCLIIVKIFMKLIYPILIALKSLHANLCLMVVFLWKK